MLDYGRPPAGGGYDALRRSLAGVLSGETVHGGALLAPFGISYIVAEPGDLPATTLRRLSRQVDLDLVPAEGLVIFHNEKSAPLAGAIADAGWVAAAESSEGRTAELGVPDVTPFTGGPQRYRGTLPAEPSLVLLAQQYDGSWRLVVDGSSMGGPSRAFGWAVGFDGPRGPAEALATFGGQRVRTVETGALAVVWFMALWMTRKRAHGG
jgi:hypothetical protein